MLLTNYKGYKHESFFEHFRESVKKAKTVRIATGYVGKEVFIAQTPLLYEVVKNGGVVQIIFGIAFWEGLKSNELEVKMREFHEEINVINNDSGIYIVHTKKFHGKFYFYEYQGHKKNIATIGSSNFSNTGFGDWNETNIVINNPEQLEELDEFFYRLKNYDTLPITQVPYFGRNKIEEDTKKRKYESSIQLFKWPAPKAKSLEEAKKLNVSFYIPIRTGSKLEKSSFNLFNGKGRLSKDKKSCKPRSWYEVENTVRRYDVCRKEINQYLPDQTAPYRFKVVTEEDSVFNVCFKRKSTRKNDLRSLEFCGLDFRSTPSEALGYFVKDKLVKAKALKEGELITEETLIKYGNDRIIFKYLGSRDSEDYFFISF